VASRIDPRCIEVLFNLASGAYRQGSLQEGITYYRRVLELQPDHPQAHNGLALALHEQGYLEAAEPHYRRALELMPEFAEARHNWSMVCLLKGDFASGWPEYEWRWKAHGLTEPQFDGRRWTGQPPMGRTILLYCEQGLGDTLQFIRYAAVVKRRGATVVIVCQTALQKLLASASGIDRLVAAGDELPPFDYYAPLLSVPGILKTTQATIPGNVPYLSAAPELVDRWRERINVFTGFRIGIHWQGRSGQGTFRQRDIPLYCFRPLADLPGVRLFSLQKGADTRDLDGGGGTRQLIDFGDAVGTTSGGFMDTAAIMKNLDLVISSDTSIPHLAGALGVPVWVALPYVPNWRWLLDRTDCPWYPTMRLFRQKTPGDWAGVVAEIHAILRSML